MKTTYYISLALFLCASVALNAQSAQKNKGDRYFDKYEYDRAIEYYELAWEENPLDATVSRRMALCFDKLSMPEMSAEWYEKTLAVDQSNPEDMIQLASALKRMERYDESLLWFKKYNRVNPSDSRAAGHLAYRKFFEKLKEDSLRYEPRRMEINNDRSALGVVKYRDGQYLVSSGGFTQSEDDELDYLPFLDVYVCDMDEQFNLVNPQLMEGSVNSRYHDGPACYTAAHNELYVTRNNMVNGKPKRDATGSVNLKIYVGYERDGEFVVKKEFGHNSNTYSNGHPTVSVDGERMIFVSNRPGGFGGTDLYICYRNGNTWGEPLNMGALINSEGDEMFPSLSNDGRLYFASDGLVGLGGLDVFYTAYTYGQWEKPENIGYPVNSHKDDFSLVYDADEDFGYFTSSRDGGIGGDDIFFFNKAMLMEKKFAIMLASTDPDFDLTGGTIVIRDIVSGRVEEIAYDGREKVEFLAKPNEHIEVGYKKDGIFVFEPVLFDAPVPSTIEDPYTNTGYFIYSETLEAADDLAFKLDAKDWNVRLFEHTEEEDNGIEEEVAVERYYIPTTKPYNEKDWMEAWDPEELTAALNNVDELFSDEYNRSSILRDLGLNNVYYDYDDSTVKEDSQKVLKGIAQIMKEYPEYTLQIVAHADTRGPSGYNLTLSKQRALSAYHYCMTQGIPKERLQTYFFGEEQPLDMNNVEELTEEEMHQLNRRAEFNILLNHDGSALIE